MSEHEDIQATSVAGEVADPFGALEDTPSKNYSRVGSVRPSALLYTSGIGATVDMPYIAVMPQGLNAWEPAYAKQGKPQVVLVPRLLAAVRHQLGHQVEELRQPPWVPENPHDTSTPVGIPTRVFPQWLRCTGCDLLAPISESKKFDFVNTKKYRPDKAKFVHKACKGRPKKGQKQGSLEARPRLAVPARYLIACTDGHLDEFPYVEWIHGADKGDGACKMVRKPELRMIEWRSNLGPQVKISCAACDASRNIAELTRAGGDKMLPRCRGRHPHLPTYAVAEQPCDADVRLMLLGAANQWFPASVSLLVLPARIHLRTADIADMVETLPPNIIARITDVVKLASWREFADSTYTSQFDGVSDDDLWEAIQIARGQAEAEPDPPTPSSFDPINLLEPEWDTLVHPDDFESEDRKAGFRVRPVKVASSLQPVTSHVVAVERVKKANAFIGFTRIDALDRLGDAPHRIAPLVQSGRPKWVPATEDRGEGVFIRFDENVVRSWEDQVLESAVWKAHLKAHELNVNRRQSTTAEKIVASERMPPPRYWALHTVSHLLIREMAMSSGYGSASLTERIYAWRRTDDRPAAAAGIFIATTSPDSEGTLGGLVDLAEEDRLQHVFRDALRRAQRCSSDPICAHRVPSGQEDFLHGAACHFCLFVSETSCEKANRFLDRRFALTLNAGPEHAVDGLFQSVLSTFGK